MTFRRLFQIAAISLPALWTFEPASARELNSVKIVLNAPLRILDPVLTSAYVTRNHGYLVYDTLFALDGDLNPKPEMVDSWSESPDKLTYTFTLRKDLKFHDGSPVTADDVIASLQRWAQRDQMGGRLFQVTEKMEAGADPASFTIRLKKPFGLLIEALAKPGAPVPFIMPKRIAAVPPSQPITEVIGSGPYSFVAADFQPGVKATYLKFADYIPRKEPASGFAGGKVAIVDRIELATISDSQTAVQALRTGEVDFVEDISSDLLPQLDNVKGVDVKSYGPNTDMFALRMNWLLPPFNNVTVRRAALAALYQVDYLEAQMGDAKFYQVCGAALSCVSPYASENGATQIRKPDLARAKALLQESGYDGTKVVILHPTDVPILSSFASVTSQALRKIGMNVEIQSMDWNSVLTRRNRKDPVDQGGWNIAHTTFSSLDLMSPVTNPNLDGRGQVGYAGWSKSEEMEALRDQFAEESDIEKKKTLAVAMQKLNYQEVFYIPLGGYSKYKGSRGKLVDMVDAPIPLFWLKHQ
jgi:peptide/nickel transport system substrate-binding protein